MLNNSDCNSIPKRTFDLSKLKIVNLGDVHYGNVACKKDFFKKVVTFIEKNTDVYWLSTGDMLDVNISKSPFYDPNSLEINDEFNELVDIIKPISYKCLGFVGSNHSHRIHKLAGLNLDQILAKFCTIPYLGNTGLINCTLIQGKDINRNRVQSYYISMTHGFSGGTTLGAKANSVQRLYDMVPNVDICLEGHTHTFITTAKEVYSINRSSNKLTSNIVTLCVCGHCLDWAKSYASSGKYQPTPVGFPLITLSSKQKNVDIKLLTPSNIHENI
jgi:predicted phosphodiesterase